MGKSAKEETSYKRRRDLANNQNYQIVLMIFYMPLNSHIDGSRYDYRPSIV